MGVMRDAVVGVLIGASVGGGVLLLIVIATVVICVRKRKTMKRYAARRTYREPPQLITGHSKPLLAINLQAYMKATEYKHKF